MAKKSAAAPITANQKVSKSRKQENPLAIPSALRYFWDYADLCWKYADAYQDRLVLRRPLLTKEYIAAQIAYVAEVKAMPNDKVRKAKSKRSRMSLSGHRQGILTEVNLLDSAIRLTFEDTPELIPVELAESGITALRDATVRDWPAVSTFLTTGKAYLKNHGQKLLDAGAIAPSFAEELETKGTEFEAAKTEYTDKKQSAKEGTGSVAAGVKKIKSAISKMQEVGKNVFEFVPELRKLFTADYVMDEVRSKHPANIVGRTDLGPVVEGTKPKPLAGILVEVLGEEGKTAITDKQGRYKIPLAGGEYQVRYSSPIGASNGMSPVVQKVVVKPGVDRRVNVALEPAPVVEFASETPLPKLATPPPASMEDALSGALKQVTGTPENGTLAVNGVEKG